MANNAQIYIIVSSKDQASKVLKGIGAQAKDMGENLEEAGEGAEKARKDSFDLEQGLGTLKSALVAAGVVAAAKAAIQLAELGAQSIRTGRAFENISGGVKEANLRLDAMRRATRGAMSEMEMMGSANQLMQMGLANNAEELESVTKMAVKLGTAMGATAGDAISNFSLMLANQSIPRLDSFGISSGKVRERIAELQKQTKGMTREQAFMTAVMEEGGIAMNRLGDDVEDEMLAVEQLGASWADLKAGLGEQLAPVLAEIVGGMAKVTQAVNEQNRTVKNYEETLGREATASAYVAAHYKGESDALEKLEQQYQDAIAEVPKLTEAELQATGVLRNAATATDELALATGGAAAAQSGLATSAREVAASFGELEFDNEMFWEMALASGASLEQLKPLAEQLGIASSAQIQATIKAYELSEAFGAGTVSAEEYRAAMGQTKKDLERMEEVADRLAGKLALSLPRAERGEGATTRYQHGGRVSGGRALVGEDGPEVVDLPRGSYVHSNDSPTTQSYTRSTEYNVTITDPLAGALFLEQTRQQQMDRINADM